MCTVNQLCASVLLKQIIYVGCAYATVYLIYAKFRATYDGNHDTFRVEFLVVPVGGLAFLVNHDFSPLEVIIRLFTAHLQIMNQSLSCNHYN